MNNFSEINKKLLKIINYSNNNFDEPSSNSANNRANMQSQQYQQRIAELEAQNRIAQERLQQQQAENERLAKQQKANENKYNQKLSTKIGNAVKGGVEVAKQNGSLVRQIAGDVAANATGQLIGAGSSAFKSWSKDRANTKKAEAKLALRKYKDEQKAIHKDDKLKKKENK